jgi:hypothetical protein
MSKLCNHKWVDMEDGTFDKFCVRCSEKEKQNFAMFEEQTCCGNPHKNGFTSTCGLKESSIKRAGQEFECRHINIESVTINVSSDADISSIAKELNQLAGMKLRKGGMRA